MRRILAAAALCLSFGVAPAAQAADPPGQASQLVVRKVKVGEIPALVVSPPDTKGRALILWYPGFSGTKEGTEGQLRQLAARGYVAMSPEVYQHGERRIEPQAQLPLRVRGNIRRYFWPILAKTAEETTPMIDWAIKELGVRSDVGIGGTSMGGDLSVAAAGVDKRIKVVSAIVATPDWMRPGSWEPPGEPDTVAQSWYDKRNPLTHLDAYRHRPYIAFQSGAVDIQVPPDGAQRFIAALKQDQYKGYEDRLEVNLIPGIGHGFAPAMMDNSISWFEAHLPKK